jgi:hypothetical protein
VTLEGSHNFAAGGGDTRTLVFTGGQTWTLTPTLLFDANNIDGYSYDYREDSRLPLFTYGATDVTNASTWTLSQIRLRPQSTINSFNTASIDLKWTVSDTFSLKFGPQWKNYVFKSTETRRSNGTTANQETVIPANAMAAPITDYSELTSSATVSPRAGRHRAHLRFRT